MNDTEIDLGDLPVDLLAALPPSGHLPSTMLSNIRTALRIAEKVDAGEHPLDSIDSIAWRLADALEYLRDVSEIHFPGCPTPGIHESTGLGAKLDTSSASLTKRMTP